MEQRLNSVFASSQPTAQLQALVDELVASADPDVLISFSDKLLSASELTHQTARQCLVYLARALKTLMAAAPACFETVATHILGLIKSQPVSHDEADYIIRDALFDYNISIAEYAEAAQILGGVNLDSTSRVYTDSEKVDILVLLITLTMYHYLILYIGQNI